MLVNVTQEQLKADGDFAVLTKAKELIWGLDSSPARSLIRFNSTNLRLATLYTLLDTFTSGIIWQLLVSFKVKK